VIVEYNFLILFNDGKYVEVMKVLRVCLMNLF